MNVIALGLDLVEVSRVRALLVNHEERFTDRVFTAGEIAYCSSCADPAVHYAARFAAKEAVSKCLGTGLSDGVIWTGIEVLRNEQGAPSVALHGEAARVAEARGISEFRISLSHTKEMAGANVVALG